ncbi:MocR-like B6 salvage transcription factor PtsJ [Herbaspirillum camelliae]|uniref:MocR-like B6 salvage transcription factor PtsJ n=1 Tax=Herbaspirillum camelliae TaxID=1892903 RepID=UPI000949DDEA|nr:transcriptional regulator PtsJ [Herbaspirillum camelliae]
MQIKGETASDIFDSVRALARGGDLLPGQALPTVRSLAATLGVNRNTVSLAYQRLAAAGVAVTQGRLGTVICEPAGSDEQEGVPPDSPLADLSSGNPAPAWLPDIGAAMPGRVYQSRLYGEPPIGPALDTLGHHWLAPDSRDGLALNLTHGAVDAVERLLATYLVAGDRVAVEDPCFLGSINTLRTQGLQAVGVPMDGEGMQALGLERALAQGAQAVIVTPRAQNPTGCSLSPERAQALREVLAQHPHVLVIVDDHFSLLSTMEYYSVLPANARRWALVRSVSKMLGPDLRLAFVGSDGQTADRLRLRLSGGTTWVSHLLQDAVSACLSSAKVGAQIQQARDDYARRRLGMAAVLQARGLRCSLPADGLNLWLPLPHSGQAVVSAMALRGWLVRAGDAFGIETPAHGLRITVSGLEQNAFDTFGDALRQVMDAMTG